MVPGSWPYGAPSQFGQSVTGSSGTGLHGPHLFPVGPPLYGANWPVFYPSGYYQSQASSTPRTYGGWTPTQPQASSMAASTEPSLYGFTPRVSRTSTFPSQPQSSSSSIGTTIWGDSPLCMFVSQNQPQALGSSTGTTSWGSLPSTQPQPTFATTPPLFGGSQTTSANGSLSRGLSTTSFAPRGSRVASYVPTPDDSGSGGYHLSISAMPVYKNKSHEELRMEDYQTLSDKGPKASLPFVSSTVSFLPQGGAVFTDNPASSDENFISISATPACSNKSHEELRMEHYNASRPIQPHASSSAASNGLGPSCCCGSLFQKQKSAGAETLVNLLTSALSTKNFPVGIGLAGQFSPDTPVLCQMQSSTSVVPTGAATSSTQTSSSTAFTWPEPGHNTAPQKTQNAPETQVSNEKISGQSTEGAFKSGLFAFPPSPAPNVPWKTQYAPKTQVSNDKIPGKTKKGAFKSGQFTFPPTNPWKNQYAPETQVSNDKIPGQSTKGAFKSGPFTFPPTNPLKTQYAPETQVDNDKIPGQSTEETQVSNDKIPGQSTEGAFKSAGPFTFPPSPATTSQCGISSIPTLSDSAPTERAFLTSTGGLNTGLNSCSRDKTNNEGWTVGICEVTTSLNPSHNPDPLNSVGDRSLETEVRNISLLEQKSSKSETVGKFDDVDKANDVSGSSAKLKLKISVPLDAFEEDEVSTHDVEAMMPKLRSPDYYTIPSIHELVEKELIEPGFCSRVKDFVVGRKDYGCIKYLGETDVRNLDLESLIRFGSRELALFEKPEAGQGLNKPSEVTLLNVKCLDKRTGKECVDGPRVDKFRQMLIRRAMASGVEFVSYDAAAGEWKFRVQHFLGGDGSRVVV